MQHNPINASTKVTTCDLNEVSSVRANDYAELHDLYEALQVTLDEFLRTSSFKTGSLSGNPITQTFVIRVKH